MDEDYYIYSNEVYFKINKIYNIFTDNGSSTCQYPFILMVNNNLPPFNSIYCCASLPAASKIFNLVEDNRPYSNPNFLTASTKDEQLKPPMAIGLRFLLPKTYSFEHNHWIHVL